MQRMWRQVPPLDEVIAARYGVLKIEKFGTPDDLKQIVNAINNRG